MRAEMPGAIKDLEDLTMASLGVENNQGVNDNMFTLSGSTATLC